MKRKSLISSILTSSIGVLVAVVLVVCSIYAVIMQIQLFKTIKQDYYHAVAAESNEMESWIAQHITISENLALSAVAEDLRGEELRNYLRTAVIGVSDCIMDCYVAWEDEAPVFTAAYFVPAGEFIPQDRGWYKAAVAAGKSILTDPYIDASTGKVVVTVATPIMKDGKAAGVCGLDIDMTELVNITNNLKLDEKGYATLIDAAGNVVVHTGDSAFNHQLEGADEKVTALTDISSVYARVLENAATGEISEFRDYDGVKRIFPAVSLGDTGWKIVYAADYGEAFSVIASSIVLIVVLAVGGMAIGGAFIYIKFTRRLKPLTGIETAINEMADGKLSHEYPSAVNDEIGIICTTLEKTNENLKTYIGEIDRRLSLMAEGNFTSESEISFVGEFTAIGESLDKIQSALHSTFSEIGSAAGQISDGSRGVASGATQLAGAVSDETSLIGGVIESVNDITDKVSKSAANAFAAKDATRATATVAGESNTRMTELLKAMSDIAASAEEIVKINATIEDIAFQTNILALNASIEAARAGAAGKGFAVVADEVRNLANKSGDASNTTSRLIGETVEVIKRGKELAQETADLLSDVVGRAEVIENSVTEISDVSEIQKSQLSEIVQKLATVSDVVQTTAATAEESAAASEELDGQVDMLRNSLARYKL